MTELHHRVLIIGSGPAGLTAAIYAARANLSPVCVEGFNAGGLIAGGQLMFTTDVENFPGYPSGITGPEMMTQFREQAEKQGTEIISADVQKVDFSERPFKVWVGEGEDILHTADAVIIATGARANYLGLESEEKLKNKGVSACAVCDGGIYRNKPVAIVGGGDTAMEEAMYLAGLTEKVYLMHRRDEFRASKAMQKRVQDNPKIEILYSTVVEEVLGVEEDSLRGLRVKDLNSGETKELTVDALFVAIGHTPMTELFKGQLETHPNGYLKLAPGHTATSVEGVFAAGDVADFTYRQAVTAAGTGCMAALDAERWLSEQEG